MDALDKFKDGVRFTVAVDPEDARFEFITIRVPRNSNVGLPDTPLCSLSGATAAKRVVRFVLGRSAGILAENRVNPKVIATLKKIRDAYLDG